MKFTQLDAETFLYVYKDKENLCFLVVYVDNLLLAATLRAFMNKIKGLLSSTFKMQDLGAVTFILGIHIKRDRKRHMIALLQHQYIDTILEHFGMKDCKPVFTPIDTMVQPSTEDPIDNTTIRTMKVGDREVSYQCIIGSLMWVMLATRPDLEYTVGVIGRYSANPKACHWSLAKCALHYLKGTQSLELMFNRSDVNIDMDFHRYSDTNWGGDQDTSHSTSGYVFISNHAAIRWSSKLQTMVSLSSTESEYVGLSNAGQHVTWLCMFFDKIGHKQRKAMELKCDNQAAIILSHDSQFRAQSIYDRSTTMSGMTWWQKVNV